METEAGCSVTRPKVQDETVQSGSVNHDFDVIYTELFEILANRIKTKTYTRETFEFERNAGKQIFHQAKMLSAGEWKPSGYNTFHIHHPERIINAPLYADRIGQTWIVEKYVKPYVSPLVLPNNMACQEGKGSKETMMRTVQALSHMYQQYGYDFWFLQYDMQGYYDNLNHEVIKQQFSGLPKMGKKLMYSMIDAWHFDEAYALEQNPKGIFGVPKGCLPSQWVGILYLNELDHILSELPGCEFAIRYMDDSNMFFHTKKECIEAYCLIEEYLKKKDMGIRMHPNKTAYAPITRGFNLCGWHYEIKPSGKVLKHLKQEKKREMYAAFKWLQREYARGKVSWTEVKDIMQGRMNYLSWGDTYHLRKYICSRFTFQRNQGVYSDMVSDVPVEKLLTEKDYYLNMGEEFFLENLL